MTFPRDGGGEGLLKRFGRAEPGADIFGRTQSGLDPEACEERGRGRERGEPSIEPGAKGAKEAERGGDQSV